MGKDDLFKKRKNKDFKRKEKNRKQKDSFLIICEGEETEPNYFRAFRVKSATIEVVGTGFNTYSLVQRAVKEKSISSYDQVWVVFDKDSFPDNLVEKAFRLAKKENIKIAFSNESFELWYVLHFDFQQSPLGRQQYIDILDKKLGEKYKKNNRNMYAVLLEKQSLAIHRARKLQEAFTTNNPSKKNPSTSVYELVCELNEFK